MKTNLEHSHVKTVSVTYGRKVNLGDYNSADLSVSVWADVNEQSSLSDAMAELQDVARESVRAEYARITKKQTRKSEE